MPQVSAQQVENARQLDLLTYLQRYEPNELIRFSANSYVTRSHDSLHISHGKWFWWSQGFGARTALDYLIKVRGMEFTQAVEYLDGLGAVVHPAFSMPEETIKKLYLPKANTDNSRAIRYLAKRGISPDIILYCIDSRMMYENEYHNVVFVGYDSSGKARYANMRSTCGKLFKGEATGSDKRFSFRIPSREPSSRLHVFECAIDLLSYCSMEQIAGRDWRAENCLSLGGVALPQKGGNISMPLALKQYLSDNPKTDEIVLHLDIDEAGRRVTVALMKQLSDSYKMIDAPPPLGKDYNDYLQIMQAKRIQKTEER